MDGEHLIRLFARDNPFAIGLERVDGEEEDDGGPHGLGHRNGLVHRLTAARASVRRNENASIHGEVAFQSSNISMPSARASAGSAFVTTPRT